ncbi:MAG TPA: hypothetical protein VMT21_03625 [Gemmatimonadales bacterium]|nr:hypothetical protein [Gemmatimonadales bacterium]
MTMRHALSLEALPGVLAVAACGGSYTGFTQGKGGGSGVTPVSNRLQPVAVQNP